MSDQPAQSVPVEPELTSEPPVLSPLEQLEAEHGFTFGGDGESAGANAVSTLVCTQPKCPNRNQHVAIHADTPLPVHCGSCNTILLCEHNMVAAVDREGTVGSPVEVHSQKCTMCSFTADVFRVELPAIDVSQLPLKVVDALG
ncbi:hypothetical protein [Subtercola vilae]|uniref:hypothetical protein n=1 Tax=Subtercola vilae TaxID=2056433 RepID=UPI0010AA5F19|nr:hypothetical protein [Subtercola vilae]